MRGGTLRIEILPPVPTTGLDPGGRDRLQHRIRTLLEIALAPDRPGPKAADGTAPEKELP